MTTLVVPGVRVTATFDVLPPSPAASGIVGVVGIVDRPAADGSLVGVTKPAEIAQVLGPGTEVSMPELVHALANGASEAQVAAVAGGGSASATLLNVDSEPAVALRCRSKGAWANDHLTAEVRGVADAAGNVVRATLVLHLDGAPVETWPDLRAVPGEVDDLLDTINRRSRYVVALDPGFTDATPADVDGTFDAATSPVPPIKVAVKGKTKTLLELHPAADADPHGLRVTLTVGDGGAIAVSVFQGGLKERFTGLVMNPDDDRFLPYVLLAESTLVRATVESSLDEGKRLPAATPVPVAFAGGTSPAVADFRTAIDRLADDTRIDLVVASVEPTMSDADVRAVHQALVAHAVAMADAAAPRIAFGAVTAAEQRSADSIRDHAAAVRNRRFVLVAPAGAAGAVAGMVGRLDVQDSPTFKPVPLFGLAAATYRESQLNVLLGPTVNLLVVEDRRGHGVIVLRGLDTSGDQISVTRVADAAIRETKAIAENFIGALNTDAARIALKQQIVGTLTRMERAGALVPSTDGSDPAFVVDVYSTQLDFAQGIVRIDIAVRPVRAIDYVYATIRVKN